MTITSVSPSSDPLSFDQLTRPFPMTFSCKEFPFREEDKNEALRVIKERMLNYSHAKVEFDHTDPYTFRLYHQEKEVQALISFLELEKYFNLWSISFTQEPKTQSFYAKNVTFTLQNDGYAEFKQVMQSTLEEGQVFYASRKVEAVVVPDDRQVRISEAFLSLLENYDGICLGEMYFSNIGSKALLINGMEKLYELGVRTLYIEHVFYDTMFQSLAEDKAISPHLELYLKNLDLGQSVNSRTYTYLNLVRKAHEVGMRVIPIDTSLSYACGSSRREGVKSVIDRSTVFNYVATRIIEEDQKREGAGKYIALMGATHLVQFHEEIPGVSELLGVPSVLMTDGNEHVMEYNFKHEELGEPVSLFLQNKVVGQKTRQRSPSTEAADSPPSKRQKMKGDD